MCDEDTREAHSSSADGTHFFKHIKHESRTDGPHCDQSSVSDGDGRDPNQPEVYRRKHTNTSSAFARRMVRSYGIFGLGCCSV